RRGRAALPARTVPSEPLSACSQTDGCCGSYLTRWGSKGDPGTGGEPMLRRFHLLAGATALAFALAAVGGAAARSQADTLHIAAAMVAANETPTPKGDVGSARGTFTATLTKSGTGGELSWRLAFSNLSGNAIAAHIHVGAAGVAGPVRVPLCAPCTSGVTGTATITAEVLDAIMNGRAYVNVHTPTNPAGEIRDQVGISASVKTTLRAAQERPKPKGKLAKAKGTFTATITRTGTTGLVSSVAYELVGEAFDTHHGNGAVAGGLFAGSAVFFVGDTLIDRMGGAKRKDPAGAQAEGSPLAIVLGIVLDGIPESLVLGLTIVVSGSVSAAFLVAVALSNIPE